MQWQVFVPVDSISHIHIVNAQDMEEARVIALAEHEARCVERASRKGDE